MAIVGTILVVLLGLAMIVYTIGYWFLNDAFTPGNKTPLKVHLIGAAGVLVALSPLVI